MPADLRTLIEQELETHTVCNAPDLESLRGTPEFYDHTVMLARSAEVIGFHRALEWVLALLPPTSRRHWRCVFGWHNWRRATEAEWTIRLGGNLTPFFRGPEVFVCRRCGKVDVEAG